MPSVSISAGAPAGKAFLVNTGDPLSDQTDPAVAANPLTGQAFVVWNDAHIFTGQGEDAEPLGIRGRAFLATTDTVNGTEGDDLIQTFSLGEPINGLGGDDVIISLGGNDIVHGNAGVDFLRGGFGDDQLFGDAGADRLKGEEGNDLLVGGAGQDTSFGGLGADRFDFNSVNESRAGAALRDSIRGFSRGEGDSIDLETIDAKTTVGGNQKFVLIGADGFHGVAGELRFAGGVLQGDTDGNGLANFEDSRDRPWRRGQRRLRVVGSRRSHTPVIPGEAKPRPGTRSRIGRRR